VRLAARRPQAFTGLRPAAPQDLTPGFKSGTTLDTVVINTDIAMAYLQRQFQSQGGRITQRTVANINEAFAWYDIVVNCTGLGSRELFNDKSLYAARGQVGTPDAARPTASWPPAAVGAHRGSRVLALPSMQ